MAESLSYAGSPFAQYLSDTGAEEDVLHDNDAPSYAEADHSSQDGDELHETKRATTPPPAPARFVAPPTRRKTANDHFSDLLKYSLATSALLNPRLSDAIPLYQARVEKPIALSSTPAAPRQSISRRSNVADWGQSWDTRGQGLADRGVLGNAVAAVRGIVGAVSRVAARSPASPALAALPSVSDLTPSAPTVHSTVLATLDRLISAAQELDLRMARALSGIREVECVTWDLGLSDPLPPISRLEAQALIASPTLSASLSASTSSARPRVPSPLGFSPATFPSPNDSSSHPPMRAMPLRRILSETFTSTIRSLKSSQTSLSSITGYSNPTPTRDTLELSRHEARALQDRLDAEAREQELEALALEQSRTDRAKRLSWNSERNPELSDSTFGGIERKTSIRSKGAHRVRPSIGTVGVFGVGTAAAGLDAAPSPTRRQRRPASLGVWPGQSLSFALKDDSEAGSATSSPAKRKPTREREQELAELQGDRTDESLGLMALQDAFEEVHDLRRALLWRVMELVDRSVEEDQWVEVGGMLDRLAGWLRQAASRVSKGVEVEFGTSGLGSDKLALGRSTSSASKRLSGMDFGSATHTTSPPRSRPLSLSLASPQLMPTSTSTRSSPSQPPAAGARHTTRPSLTLDFAPPPPSSSQTSLVVLEQRNTAISVALRTIAAKVHIVQDDAKRRAASSLSSSTSSTSSPEVDRLLATHDSIRADLETLLREWEDSRVALRGVLKPVESKPPLSRSSSAEEDDMGSTSLDSIPDVELEERVGGEANDPGLELVSADDGLEPAAAERSGDKDESYLAPAGVEQVYEAVAGTREGKDGGTKLSREERIRASKEARERKPASSSGGFKLEAGMVAELKDVLVLLKERHHLPVDA